MSPSAAERHVAFAPHTRVFEDGQWILGRPETGVFLVLEPDAVQVIDWLSAGATVGEAARRYRGSYGEDLDIEGFLGQLVARGLVVASATGPGDSERAPERVAPVKRFHLEGLSPRLARRIFGPPTLVAIGVLAALAVAALAGRPALVPSWEVLYFPERLGLFGTTLLAASLAAIALHELAHLTAARAAGVASRFGFGTRLWIPVAETDLTGIWSVERRQRYLPFLAGPIVDVAGASVLVLGRFAHTEGWIHLPSAVERFAAAMLLVYLLSLLWQCYFFVRTDFYYVLATWLRCKNLMEDTEAFLADRLRRLIPGLAPRAAAALPEHETRAVRGFAVVWLAGRAVAVVVLLTVQLPLAWSYLRLLGRAMAHATRTGEMPGSAVLLPLVSILALATGLAFWLSQLAKRKR